MKEKTYIYSLSFPEGNIRYIGKSDEPKKRLRSHIYEAKRNKWNSYKNNWIRQLLAEGNKPIVNIIEEVDDEKWAESEIYWIAQFKVWNFDLVNIAKGGQGIKFYTEEIRKKISESLNGIKRSEETKEKMSKAAKGNKNSLGKVLSDETKNKMSEAQKGKIAWNKEKSMSEKTKIKISQATKGEKNHFFGKKHSDEANNKNREAHLGKPSPNKGKKMSDEQKNKISKARKGKPGSRLGKKNKVKI